MCEGTCLGLCLSLLRVTKGMGVLTHKGYTLRKKRGMTQSYLPRLACSQALAKEVTTWVWLELGERTR